MLEDTQIVELIIELEQHQPEVLSSLYLLVQPKVQYPSVNNIFGRRADRECSPCHYHFSESV